MEGDRYCVECCHYDGEHRYCEHWERYMPPLFKMTPEHDCPHWDDLFDWADREFSASRAEWERKTAIVKRNAALLEKLGR